ncbi:MAG: hypothetical protein SGILL_009468 [Bacillariaceae sp.]
MIYIIIVTFTDIGVLGVFGGNRDPETGTIIDVNSEDNTENGIIAYDVNGHAFTRAIVATDAAQMVLLGLSRMSAFFMYPAIVCVFWSKYRALQAFFSHTPFVVFFICDTHALHVYCGWVIFIDALLHTTCHLIRWGMQGNLYLLFDHVSGITGFITIISTLIIVIPMTFLKSYVSFELRKTTHYLFWVYCVAMSLHAPIRALPNGGFCAFVFPILIIIYALDSFYAKCFMSERISTVKYETCSSGVQLSMPVSKRFQKQLTQGGYAYIMFEWLNKQEWHAFSVYDNGLDENTRHVFIAKEGDWTNKLHAAMDRNTSRPVWISGPFPSPYSNTVNYDNLILVATGIGITPALNTIEAYRDSRRVSLVWAVREASMLVFFLKNAKLDHKGFNLVFYTGKEPLPSTIENFQGNVSLQIIHERPKVANLIPNIIHHIDAKPACRPEKALLPDKSHLALALLKEEAMELDAQDLTAEDKLGKLQTVAEDIGYDIAELMDHLPERENDDEKFPLLSTETRENVEWNAAKYLLEIHAFDKTPEEVLQGYTARCDCATDHISYPHHRHSKWSTSSTSILSMKHNLNDPLHGSRSYVRSMSNDSLQSWGLFFCGRRNKVLELMQKEAKELHLPLHEEAFDW